MHDKQCVGVAVYRYTARAHLHSALEERHAALVALRARRRTLLQRRLQPAPRRGGGLLRCRRCACHRLHIRAEVQLHRALDALWRALGHGDAGGGCPRAVAAGHARRW